MGRCCETSLVGAMIRPPLRIFQLLAIIVRLGVLFLSGAFGSAIRFANVACVERRPASLRSTIPPRLFLPDLRPPARIHRNWQVWIRSCTL